MNYSKSIVIVYLVFSYSQWQRALNEFQTWASKMNVLVNNVGILYSGAFEQTDIAAHHRTVDINVKGVLNSCHALICSNCDG